MRRVLLFVILLAVVLCAGYFAWWQYVAWEVRDNLGPWAEARRAEGAEVHWDAVRIDGFPFQLRVSFDNFRVSGVKPLPYEASGPEMVFAAAPWDLHLWRYSAPQGARLEALSASAGFDAQALEGLVVVPFAEHGWLVVSARGLAGRGTAEGFAALALQAEIRQPDTPPANERDAFLLVSFDVTGLGLPKPPPPLGPTIQEISVGATIRSALSPGPLPQMLDAWRQAGGAIELSSSHLRWDDLDIHASGTAALDEKLQPIAALTAIIAGQDALVDAAVNAGVMQPNAAALAKAVLGMVAKPDAGGQPRVTLPLSAQNQKLYLGPAAVARIPVINWE